MSQNPDKTVSAVLRVQKRLIAGSDVACYTIKNAKATVPGPRLSR